MKLTRHGTLGVATTAALVFAAVAFAVQTPIEDVDLEAGGGDAIFDASADSSSCHVDDEGFSPVEDGSFSGESDAFDGGLILLVNGQPFIDGDDEGDLVGDQLTVGPEAFPGLTVRRIERGLPGSPTLRTLIELKNSRKKKTQVDLVLDSDLGSDSSTIVRESSSGDGFFSAKDRWVVTSDSATDPPGDPAIAHVFFGKGKVVKLGAGVVEVQGGECMTTGFTFDLPGKAKRYLLVFTELAETNADAIAGATKFNKKKLNGALKSGLKKSVRKKVVNWDIAPRKKGKKK